MKKFIAVLLIVMLSLCPAFSIAAFAEDVNEPPIENNLPANIKDFAFWMSFLSNGMAASNIDSQELGAQLAQEAVYSNITLSDGTKTIYVYLNIEDNENSKYLLNGKTIKEFANNVYDAQSELAGENEDMSLMSINHIAGEAWLHVMGYAFSGLLGGENGIMRDFHNQCKIAELNINEERLPTFLIEIVGRFFLSF